MTNIDSKKLAENTLYAGYFFNKEEVDKLASAIPEREGLSKDIEEPHVTVVFKPSDIAPEDVGSETRFMITGYANDGENEGFKIEDTTEVSPYALAKLQERQASRGAEDLGLHITLSIGIGCKAVNTAFLDFEDIAEPMQITGTYCIMTKDGYLLTSQEDVIKYMEGLEKGTEEKIAEDKPKEERPVDTFLGIKRKGDDFYQQNEDGSLKKIEFDKNGDSYITAGKTLYQLNRYNTGTLLCKPIPTGLSELKAWQADLDKAPKEYTLTADRDGPVTIKKGINMDALNEDRDKRRTQIVDADISFN